MPQTEGMQTDWWLGVMPKSVASALALVCLTGATLMTRASAVLGEDLVRAGQSPSVVRSEVERLHVSMASAGLVAAAVGILGYVFIARLTLILPLRELTRVTRQIARDGDLTRDVRIRSTDEVGQLASTLSAMVQRMRAIPMGIRESTQQLAASVAKLGASAGEQNERLTRQAGALEQTQITAQAIRETSRLAAEQAQCVLLYAERAESVSRTGEVSVSQSLAALRDIQAQVREIAERIASLGERTLKIGEVTQTVKDLADQSNMLALNSAIEAVRSGEHGKGFAVVAREIRSLADQSIRATNEVRELLEDITEAIRGAVAITERGSQRIEAGLAQVKTSGEKLSELSNIVKDNSNAVRQINAAVGQQNEGIAHLFRAITTQGDLMTDTMKRLEATDEAVQTISHVSRSLVEIVERFRA